MFKQRLSQTVAYLITFSLLVSGFYAFYWILTLPIVGAVLKVGIVGVFLLVICAAVIEFINWLIVDPYRTHKRKRETEGPVE